MVNVSYIVMVVILTLVVFILNSEYGLYCDGGHTHGGGDHRPTQW